MITLRLFSHEFESVPAATSWYVTSGEKGCQFFL
jgi:hypothetical protein